jgi:transcriptional regulator with PAS, ATPase and Fis domain
LFLDEIGSLPLELQGKLLRVLQDGQYVKLGSSEVQTTDVRIIAATNVNLEKMVAQNSFRKDLYYRLKGGWLHLPPLRDRKDDIPLLVSRFLEECCGPGGADIEEEALSVLMTYDYPGNVRELKSIIQAAVNLAQKGPISVNFLPNQMEKRKSKLKAALPSQSTPRMSLAEAERAHILETYYQLNKNKSQTAEVLGISPNTLRRKIESYGVE